MAIASFILGLISLIASIVPFLGIFAIIPIILSIIFGIINLVSKSFRTRSGGKGFSIAGIVLSSIAIIITVYWIFFIFVMGNYAINQKITNENIYDDFNQYESNNDEQIKKDVKITVENVEISPLINEIAPSSGNIFLICDVTIENKSNVSLDYSRHDFKLKDKNGNTRFVSSKIYDIEDMLGTGTIAIDGTVTGNVYFEVPSSDIQNYTLIYDGVEEKGNITVPMF